MSPNSYRGRLLLIDDEPDLLDTLGESLRKQGFEVAGFANPVPAVEALQAGGFDLLLSDLMLPEFNGLELLQKGLRVDPNLVGIIMTGQGSVEAALDAMKAGAFDFLVKPFRMRQVLALLDRAMGVRGLRVENTRLRQEVEQLTAEKHRLLEKVNSRQTGPAGDV